MQKFIKRAVVERHDYLVLETSSHSLDQHRVWGVDYDIAVITNVTREHLDYHKTMEKYRKAKKKLFENAEKIVVNMDMEKPEEFLGVSAKEKWGYCVEMQSANLNMLIRQLEVDESKFPRLKERIGHRISEVIVGGIFGFILTILLTGWIG